MKTARDEFMAWIRGATDGFLAGRIAGFWDANMLEELAWSIQERERRVAALGKVPNAESLAYAARLLARAHGGC